MPTNRQARFDGLVKTIFAFTYAALSFEGATAATRAEGGSLAGTGVSADAAGADACCAGAAGAPQPRVTSEKMARMARQERTARGYYEPRAAREPHMWAIMASPNSEHFTSFAPSICRAKS